MYEGRTSVQEGKVLGHENMGQVIAVGDGVDRVRVGDRVVLPFNVGCGFCKNCESGLTGFCLTANPGNAAARAPTRASRPSATRPTTSRAASGRD
jgi:glutathione-independent formaldehyde dehydrogenase